MLTPSFSPGSFRRGIAAMLVLLASASCMSLGRSSFQADHGSCVLRHDLAGVWRSRRESQLGASRITLKLDCDCRYRMTISMRVGRMIEDGEYRIEDDQLIFSRVNGDTSWPFRIANEKLVIYESGTEAHDYERVGVASCGVGATADKEAAMALRANRW
jgi:hypothetical protein